VRNPLAAIGAACRSLIEDAQDEDSRARLQMIDDEVGRLGDLVNRQLRRTRHRPEEAEPVDLTQLVGNLMCMMKYQMPDAIHLRTDLPRRLMARLPSNGLRQALLNLIRNAQEAQARPAAPSECPSGGRGRIEIQSRMPGLGFPMSCWPPGPALPVGQSEGTGLAMAERLSATWAARSGSRTVRGWRPGPAPAAPGGSPGPSGLGQPPPWPVLHPPMGPWAAQICTRSADFSPPRPPGVAAPTAGLGPAQLA
jgi:hypothetical protein